MHVLHVAATPAHLPEKNQKTATEVRAVDLDCETHLCQCSSAGHLGGRCGAVQAAARDRELVTLVCAARAGERSAWSSLVRRFDHNLRAIARSYRLAPTDIDDVVQASWLNLLENIKHVREPAAIGGWLATTTRRNAMGLRRSRSREQLTDDPQLSARCHAAGPEADMLAAERREAVARALTTLPARHRQLMTVLVDRPTLDYRQVGEALAMPVGSIGPIRARSLIRLSRNPQLRALRHDATFTPC